MSVPVPSLRSVFFGFALLALIAGALLSFGADETDAWFSWTIQPPLSAAALGAFYWGACALLLTAARATTWAARRPVALPVLVIAVVLLAVTLAHLDKFDLDSLFGIFWLCAYIVAPPLLGAAILRERTAEAGGWAPLPPAIRAVLAVEGVILAVAAAVMLISPGTAADAWPWALTPLTSRSLGAFTLGVALVALLVVRDDSLVELRGTALAYAALGVLQLLAVALHAEDLRGEDAATAAYVVFWAAASLTGLYGLIAASASSRS